MVNEQKSKEGLNVGTQNHYTCMLACMCACVRVCISTRIKKLMIWDPKILIRYSM